MTPSSQPDDRDPLSAYVDGDPDAVRAVRPPEPGEAEWDEVRQRIHARLSASPGSAHPRRRLALWAAVGAVLTTAAAVVAWVAVGALTPRQPAVPDVAEGQPAPKLPVVRGPHEAQPDPLAEFAVLPMASSDEVVLHRVPGDGWFPIGAHPLPGMLALATADEVELDDPDEVWPNATTSPDRAPMIFAAKPR